MVADTVVLAAGTSGLVADTVVLVAEYCGPCCNCWNCADTAGPVPDIVVLARLFSWLVLRLLILNTTA